LSDATTQTFSASLRKSRLLTDEQLRRLFDARAAPSLSALTQHLVERGLLTSWQIRQLRSGHSNFRVGKYTLVDILGRGKMGVVYKARRTQSPARDTVALKIMASTIAEDRRKSARFRREIRLISSLKSPYVVAALDAGHAAGRYFLVTDFIPGWNLLEWLEKNRRMPVGWVCECMRQAALGLQHIHERGLIHRDLKPSNLMVTADSIHDPPQLRILDLGLGRFVGATDEGGDLTCAGHTVGTLDYMAPEQINNGRDADVRADIYSLGCTLYLLLTCRLPFEGSDVGTKLMAKFTTDPPLLNTLRDDVPHDLAQIVAKMMHRDRGKRVQTPDEVIEAFGRFSAIGKPRAKANPATSAVGAEFLESVESLNEAVPMRRPPRQNATKRLIAWFGRFFASRAVETAAATRTARG
jgi:serine/threonine protein kinase